MSSVASDGDSDSEIFWSAIESLDDLNPLADSLFEKRIEALKNVRQPDMLEPLIERVAQIPAMRREINALRNEVSLMRLQLMELQPLLPGKRS